MLSPPTPPRALDRGYPPPHLRAWIGWILPIVLAGACSTSGGEPADIRPDDDTTTTASGTATTLPPVTSSAATSTAPTTTTAPSTASTTSTTTTAAPATTAPTTTSAPTTTTSTTTTAPTTTVPTTTTTAPSAALQITIANFAFSGDSSGSVGDTVTVRNNDSVAHTWTAVGGAFDSGTLGGGATFSFTFESPGTFDYICQIHPSMTGSITIAG